MTLHDLCTLTFPSTRIPHPNSLLASLDNQYSCTTGTPPPSTPSPSTPLPVIVRCRNVAATLVPCGFGQSDWSKFGQCLCMDWLPGNGHTKIAAGFSNGEYITVDDEALPADRVPSFPGSFLSLLHRTTRDRVLGNKNWKRGCM